MDEKLLALQSQGLWSQPATQQRLQACLLANPMALAAPQHSWLDLLPAQVAKKSVRFPRALLTGRLPNWEWGLQGSRRAATPPAPYQEAEFGIFGKRTSQQVRVLLGTG